MDVRALFYFDSYAVATGNADDRRFLRKLKCNYMILDEGHMLKNMQSQRYQGLMKLTVSSLYANYRRSRNVRNCENSLPWRKGCRDERELKEDRDSGFMGGVRGYPRKGSSCHCPLFPSFHTQVEKAEPVFSLSLVQTPSKS